MLFDSLPATAQQLEIVDGELQLFDGVWSSAQAEGWFQALMVETDWQQDEIQIYGKQVAVPRLSAWYGDPGLHYQYSGLTLHPQAWSQTLLVIKQRVTELVGYDFNSVLINLYRDGNDGVAWHSDDEPELGKDPVIASVSFGASRKFSLRHKFNRELPRQDFYLPDNSLLLMAGQLQRYWQHQIAKTSKPVGPRINLTFRKILIPS